MVATIVLWRIVFAMLSNHYRTDAFGGKKNTHTQTSFVLSTIGWVGQTVMIVAVIAFGLYRESQHSP